MRLQQRLFWPGVVPGREQRFQVRQGEETTPLGMSRGENWEKQSGTEEKAWKEVAFGGVLLDFITLG